MILNDLCNELFTIEHLSNKTDGLKDFKCSKGIGLEHYLRKCRSKTNFRILQEHI